MLSRLFQFLTGRIINAMPNIIKSVRNFADPALIQLNELSPMKEIRSSSQSFSENNNSIHSEKSIPPSVVCREAVLNRSQKIAGYSFTLTRNVNDRIRKSSEYIQRLCDDVLLGNILRMDIQRLLGNRLVFIPILPSSLARPPLDHLPRDGVVLIISSFEELINENYEHLAQIVLLKNSGFRIGLKGDITLPGLQPFVDLAEFIFIDIGVSDLPTIKTQIDEIIKHAINKSLVATNIRLLDEFHVCSKLPFHYFQGTFVTSMEKWTIPAMDAGRVKIINLLNLIRQDVNNLELVQTFKQDPALSFKIMRCINTAGFGLANKISSIDQALLFLGRQNLYRWLTLLLFTSGSGNPLDLALMENALARARLAELCASDSLPENERDELFIAGVFSLLDVLLRMPINKVLDQVSLPSLVVGALLHKRGKYAPYLELAIACENSDQDHIVELSNQLKLSLEQVTAHQIEALVWAGLASH